MTIGKELQEILVCPRCRGRLELTQQGDALICAACRLHFEIRGDIPILLIDQARKLGEDRGSSSGRTD